MSVIDKGRNVLFHCTLYICEQKLMSYIRVYSAPRNSQLRGKLSRKDNYVCVLCHISETTLKTLQFLWVLLLSHEFPYLKVLPFCSPVFLFGIRGTNWGYYFSGDGRGLPGSGAPHVSQPLQVPLAALPGFSSRLMLRHMVPTLKEAYGSFLLEAASSLMAVRQLSVREPILPGS